MNGNGILVKTSPVIESMEIQMTPLIVGIPCVNFVMSVIWIMMSY